jgi:hypothetical protein
MSNVQNDRVAILWRGDRATRKAATPQNNRYRRIFEELQACGIHAEPAVYADDMLDEVRQQLLAVDGVLVWVNPLDDGLTRAKLDPMLREVASIGPWVSETSRLGHRHPPLPHTGRVSRRLSGHARFRRSARAEAKPRQRRSRYLEGGADILSARHRP